jgi:hypothetical protein
MADNVKITYAFLRRKGFTAAQAAGVIGSMQGESGKNLNPAAENPGPDHALGIAQWLGGRKNAAVRSKKLMPQLNHLWQELQGPERGALRSIKAAKTPEQAAIAWQRDFERGAPFEQKYDQRAANARNVFRQLGNSKITSLPSGGSQDSPGGTTVTRVTTPGITIGAGSRMVQDPDAQKRVILANLIKQRQPDSPLLKLGILDPNESTMIAANDPGVTIPGVTKTTRTTSGSLTGGSRGGGGGRGSVALGGKHSPLFELIHNTGSGGPGYAVKNGQKVDGRKVFASVWDGHRTHVHVAAGPNTIVKLGRMAQEMGLHAGENPHFGGVTAVHVPGSYHYKGEAIDVSGDPQKMKRYARRVEQVFGLH